MRISIPFIFSVFLFFLIGSSGGFILSNYIQSLKKTSLQPTPTHTYKKTSPTPEKQADKRVYCKQPRPQSCTLECIVPPPFICGSNGKSYCSTCQACGDEDVEWYQIQVEPCPDISLGPRPLGDAASKEECLQKGGTWQAWGLLGQEYCQIPAKDAGKSCTDGSECQYGLCMARDQASQGVCATYRQEFGCYSTIENGQPGPALCVD